MANEPPKPRDPKPESAVTESTRDESELIDLHGPLAVAENTNDEPKRTHTPPQQRHMPRVLLGVEIGIDDRVNFYVGFSENISAGGVFVATYRVLPVGTEVALTFVLPDERPLFVHGFVRWVRKPEDLATTSVPPGMGIEFKSLGQEERSRLSAFIDTCVPPPGP